MTNGYIDKVENLEDTSAKYFQIKLDDENLEQANDVYPISVEEEMSEIRKTAQNLNFLRNTLNTYDYCRTRCKISDQHLRNIVAFPKENQMCFTDCLNVRYELYLPERPENSDKAKKFVWTA